MTSGQSAYLLYQPGHLGTLQKPCGTKGKVAPVSVSKHNPSRLSLIELLLQLNEANNAIVDHKGDLMASAARIAMASC